MADAAMYGSAHAPVVATAGSAGLDLTIGNAVAAGQAGAVLGQGSSVLSSEDPRQQAYHLM